MRVERGTGPWCGSVCEVVGTRRARSAAGLGHGHAFVVSVRVVRAAERREEMEEGDDTVAVNDWWAPPVGEKSFGACLAAKERRRGALWLLPLDWAAAGPAAR